jgi:hypothetical protein
LAVDIEESFVWDDLVFEKIDRFILATKAKSRTKLYERVQMTKRWQVGFYLFFIFEL